MCKFDMSCDLLLNTPPMNYQTTLKTSCQALQISTMEIFSICAPKRHIFAVTSLTERPTKAEVRRRNIRDTTASCSGGPKMSGSV